MKKYIKLLIFTFLLSVTAATAAGCSKTADEGVLVPVPPHVSMPGASGSGNPKGEDVPTPQPPTASAPDGEQANEGEQPDNPKEPDNEEPDNPEEQEPKIYYVIFSYGDYEFKAEYTDGDESVTEPHVPQKEGYTSRWQSYSLTYGEDVFVKAEYELNVYVIIFKADGEEFKLTYTFFDKSVEPPPVPAKKGYANGRWADYALTYGDDVTVSAEYDLVLYNITFVAGDFKKTVTYSIENTDFTEPQVPEKQGYIGGNWQNYTLSFDGDITVYAQYTPLPATPDDCFEWAANDDGYTVTEYKGKDENVIIPSVHEGLPVTQIGNGAFMQNPSICAVVTGENMRIIENNAFYSCANLTSVALNEGLEAVNSAAFAYCGITEIKFPSTLKAIGKQAFYAAKISTLTVTGGIQSMDTSAFGGCENLVSVIIENGVKEISKSAFERCSNLKTVFISESVVRIQRNAFKGCESLEAAEFADAENWYSCNEKTSQSVKLGNQLADKKRAAELLSYNTENEYQKVAP